MLGITALVPRKRKLEKKNIKETGKIVKKTHVNAEIKPLGNPPLPHFSGKPNVREFLKVILCSRKLFAPFSI